MALKETLQKTGELNKKYDYYKALGYSDEAASVLACFTYGDFVIAKFATELGGEDILKKVYEFVGDDNIEDAVRKIREKYIPVVEDDMVYSARPLRGRVFRRASAASAGIEEEPAMDAEPAASESSKSSEAMNQMMGTSATSLSSMLGVPTDISTPVVNRIDVESIKVFEKMFDTTYDKFVKIAFRMTISDLIDSPDLLP